MSLDMVDDLHNAEDHIGVLRSVIRDLLAVTPPPALGCEMEEVRIARLLIADDVYCRPTCSGPDGTAAGTDDYGHVWPEEHCEYECGCPCHREQEFNDDTERWEYMTTEGHP